MRSLPKSCPVEEAFQTEPANLMFWLTHVKHHPQQQVSSRTLQKGNCHTMELASGKMEAYLLVMHVVSRYLLVLSTD
eukprot:956316-Amphidinium_carterae.1